MGHSYRDKKCPSTSGLYDCTKYRVSLRATRGTTPGCGRASFRLSPDTVSLTGGGGGEGPSVVTGTSGPCFCLVEPSSRRSAIVCRFES